MLCWVSALHSFLHRKHKQEVKPSPERSATHQRYQEVGELLFYSFFIARVDLRLHAHHVLQVTTVWHCTCSAF